MVMVKNRDVLAIIPTEFAKMLSKVFDIDGTDIYEIRMITGRPVYLVTSEGIRFVSSGGALSCLPDLSAPTVTYEALEELTDKAMGYSAYAHSDELKSGFVTYGAGIRIGIASKGNSGSMKLGEINSVCIRLPTDAPRINAGDLDILLEDLKGGLLIAGPPASGKTTMLRYCARKLSDDSSGCFRRVSVIDERMELGGVRGNSYDLGYCTDIISGKSKAEGIMTALRCFSPDIMICDEIGSEEETEKILEGLNSGVIFIASMHAGDISQLVLRSQFRKLFDENVFSTVAMLSAEKKGCIEKLYSRREVNDEIGRSFACGDILPAACNINHRPLSKAY